MRESEHFFSLILTHCAHLFCLLLFYKGNEILFGIVGDKMFNFEQLVIIQECA